MESSEQFSGFPTRSAQNLVPLSLISRSVTSLCLLLAAMTPVRSMALLTNWESPLSHVRSRCTPGDKQKYLKQLKADEKERLIVCGDGTNDAIALAEADIGVHINTGSDVAQAAADVVLVRPHLTGILVLLDLSKAAFHRISFNFAWAFVYSLFAMLLAGGALVNARITPQYAGLGEIVSVLPVILIALHLKLFQRQY
jgi:Cd2+-exporting ATPase